MCYTTSREGRLEDYQSIEEPIQKFIWDLLQIGGKRMQWYLFLAGGMTL